MGRSHFCCVICRYRNIQKRSSKVTIVCAARFEDGLWTYRHLFRCGTKNGIDSTFHGARLFTSLRLVGFGILDAGLRDHEV